VGTVHRVGSVTLRPASFQMVVIVHLVVHVCSVRDCACLVSALHVPVIECPSDVMDPPGHFLF